MHQIITVKPLDKFAIGLLETEIAAAICPFPY
jgi:hypothetical protein